jgi:hypothetical protein
MTEEPIKYASLARKVKARDALTEMPATSLTETMFLAGREPRLETRGVEVVQPHYTSDEQTPVFKVDVEVARAKLGVHVFGPGMTGTSLPARRKLFTEEENRESLVGYLPDHLALRVRPEKLDKRLATRKKIDALGDDDPETRWATTVFAPDNRYTFSDTSFPWDTAGRSWWAPGTCSPAATQSSGSPTRTPTSRAG